MIPAVRSLRLYQTTLIEFGRVDLHFVNDRRENVFAGKNNKTVRETLNHRRYRSLVQACTDDYSGDLDSPLGKFLLQLKRSGDLFYRQFLNKHGDLAYSTFSISDPAALNARGIYAYYSGDALKYIGRCRDSMKRRVNQGYGRIYPKNCYRDGQATNCHLNARIAAAASTVTLWLYRMEDNGAIETVERALIREYGPPWNIQRG